MVKKTNTCSVAHEDLSGAFFERVNGTRKEREENYSWRGSRLTLTYKAGQAATGKPTGIELSCWHKKHGKCRLSLAFSKCGGAENTERALKMWALDARKCATQKAHLQMKRQAIAELPTLEELDAMPFYDGRKRPRAAAA